jgi:hypothetical protein
MKTKENEPAKFLKHVMLTSIFEDLCTNLYYHNLTIKVEFNKKEIGATP